MPKANPEAINRMKMEEEERQWYEEKKKTL